MSDRTLYVVCVVSNPIRFESRYRLFREFRARMEATPGVQLVCVEQAFGDRPFEVTEQDNRWHVQVRAGAESEVWVKESLINIGFRHLSGQQPGWAYGAWIDADIEFLSPTWVEETVEALQHFRIVQPWSRALDLDPHGVPMSQSESFAYSYWQDQAAIAATGYTVPAKNGIQRLHPGFAWAIRRETLEALGGLLDWLPMGSGDFFMAHAFVDNLQAALKSKVGTDRYKRRVLAWGELATQYVQRDVGYVDGTILHHFHGKKRLRFYLERDRALHAAGFDPDRDLKYNAQGLLVLTGKNLKLRDTLRRYLRSRNEDDNCND